MCFILDFDSKLSFLLTTMNSTSYRMEKAFLTQCFVLINQVQSKEFQSYRKSLWQPKNRNQKIVKVG